MQENKHSGFRPNLVHYCIILFTTLMQKRKDALYATFKNTPNAYKKPTNS